MVERLTFVALVVAWAAPLVAVEWALGWRTLLEQRRALAVAVAMATVYLGLADVAAVHDGIWAVAAERRLPPSFGSFVFEDWLFVFALNVIAAQAVVLAFDKGLRERVQGIAGRLPRRRRR